MVAVHSGDPWSPTRNLASTSRSGRTPARAGWELCVCVAAGEAGGSFRYSYSPRRSYDVYCPSADPARTAAEAARRARAKLRRYCAANGLNRLGTLTYRGDGCYDPKQLRQDVGEFFRRMRSGLGGKALPYAWTAEWHMSGHG